jgi:cytochrome c oxidase cbb3-type subunit 4
MDLTLFRSIMTVLMFVIFIGICVWAWSGKRKKEFEDAANLPFADEDETDEQN